MLRTDQREFLHRIAAFSGRFTFEDALAVAGDDVLSRTDSIECLADLVDKSFIMVDLGDSTMFYRLYETMREYARQKSREAGDLEETRRRHAMYLTALFAKAVSRCRLEGSASLSVQAPGSRACQAAEITIESSLPARLLRGAMELPSGRQFVEHVQCLGHGAAPQLAPRVKQTPIM